MSRCPACGRPGVHVSIRVPWRSTSLPPGRRVLVEHVCCAADCPQDTWYEPVQDRDLVKDLVTNALDDSLVDVIGALDKERRA